MRPIQSPAIEGEAAATAALASKVAVHEGGEAERSYTRSEALRTNAFWILLVGIAIGSVANNGIPATLAPILVDRGFAFDVAAGALFFYGLASTGTKLVWGWIVGRIPVRVALLILTAFGSFALPAILVWPQIGPDAYAFLCGTYIGAYYALSQVVWADYFGRGHVGAISALGRPLSMMAGASGPFLLAITRDLTGSYDLGIWANGASAALCFLALLLVRPPHRYHSTRLA
jgi:hypothetical protein